MTDFIVYVEELAQDYIDRLCDADNHSKNDPKNTWKYVNPRHLVGVTPKEDNS